MYLHMYEYIVKQLHYDYDTYMYGTMYYCSIVYVVPSAVRDLTVHVNHTNVTATWSTPTDVNGELLYYKVC